MYAEMQTGETTLAFVNNDMLSMNIGVKAKEGIKNCFEIAFSTDDVTASYQKAVANGAGELKKAEVKPWGQTVAHAEDPFGTIVEICTPIE